MAKLHEKPKHTLLEMYYDELWGAISKVRAFRQCQRCLTCDNIQSHHIIKRRKRATRHDLMNADVLCAACHTFAERWQAEYHAELIQRIGLVKFDELSRRSQNLKDYAQIEGHRAELRRFHLKLRAKYTPEEKRAIQRIVNALLRKHGKRVRRHKKVEDLENE